ncbi:hypothetical protein MMPV_003165 [Pyropia vietnamensis]
MNSLRTLRRAAAGPVGVFESRGWRRSDLATAIRQVRREVDPNRVSLNRAALRRLVRLLYSNARVYVMVGLAAAVAEGFTLPLFSILFGRFTGVFFESPAAIRSTSWKYLLVFIAVGVFAATVLSTRAYCLRYAAHRLSYVLRTSTLVALLAQDVPYFEAAHTHGFSDRLQADVRLIQDAIAEVGDTVVAASQLGVSLVISCVYGWQLTLVVLGLSPLLLTTITSTVFLFAGLSRQLTLASSLAGAVAADVLAAVRTVQALNAEAGIADRYARLLRTVLSLGRRECVLQSSVAAVGVLVAFSLQGFVLWWGGELVARGAVAPENVLVVFFTLISGVVSLAAKAQVGPELAKAAGVARFLFDIQDRVPVRRPPSFVVAAVARRVATEAVVRAEMERGRRPPPDDGEGGGMDGGEGGEAADNRRSGGWGEFGVEEGNSAAWTESAVTDSTGQSAEGREGRRAGGVGSELMFSSTGDSVIDISWLGDSLPRGAGRGGGRGDGGGDGGTRDGIGDSGRTDGSGAGGGRSSAGDRDGSRCGLPPDAPTPPSQSLSPRHVDFAYVDDDMSVPTTLLRNVPWAPVSTSGGGAVTAWAAEAALSPGALPPVPSPLRRGVAWHQVSFSYPTRDRLVLRNVSLSVRAGETLALVGHSGSGKSTLLATLLRWYDVTPGHGDITVDGVSIYDVDLRSLRKSIGHVPQEPLLLSGTVAENIAAGCPGASLADVAAAAAVANADGFIRSLPAGYHTEVGERGTALSAGQKQRVAIARAVVADPPLLLLDEWSSALDGTAEAAVSGALRAAATGRTTVIAAHRLSTVIAADAIAVLADGAVVEVGTHEQLLAAGGAYAGLVRAQAFWADDPALVGLAGSDAPVAGGSGGGGGGGSSPAGGDHGVGRPGGGEGRSHVLPTDAAAAPRRRDAGLATLGSALSTDRPTAPMSLTDSTYGGDIAGSGPPSSMAAQPSSSPHPSTAGLRWPRAAAGVAFTPAASPMPSPNAVDGMAAQPAAWPVEELPASSAPPPPTGCPSPSPSTLDPRTSIAAAAAAAAPSSQDSWAPTSAITISLPGRSGRTRGGAPPLTALGGSGGDAGGGGGGDGRGGGGAGGMVAAPSVALLVTPPPAVAAAPGRLGTVGGGVGKRDWEELAITDVAERGTRPETVAEGGEET